MNRAFRSSNWYFRIAQLNSMCLLIFLNLTQRSYQTLAKFLLPCTVSQFAQCAFISEKKDMNTGKNKIKNKFFFVFYPVPRPTAIILNSMLFEEINKKIILILNFFIYLKFVYARCLHLTKIFTVHVSVDDRRQLLPSIVLRYGCLTTKYS